MSAHDPLEPPQDADVHQLLMQTARREYAPRKSLVAGAMKRLRLRDHAVVHVNTLLGGFLAIASGFASLCSLDEDKRDV